MRDGLRIDHVVTDHDKVAVRCFESNCTHRNLWEDRHGRLDDRWDEYRRLRIDFKDQSASNRDTQWLADETETAQDLKIRFHT